jgi:phosphoglycerate kinase
VKKLTIRDLEVALKKVFVRVDFNVPLDDQQNITDDTRIRSAIPTIRYLIDKKAVTILASHLGRPKGVSLHESLKPVAERLGKLLGKEVTFVPECIGTEVEAMVGRAQPSDVLLLENLRFHPEEEKNDPEFSKKLARLADLYVNDAFGTAHRAHASTEGMAKFFDQPVAGFLMEKEIEYLSRVVEKPERPFIAILGGAKVSDKLGVIANLLPKVDRMLLGGGLIFTIFKAIGYPIGKSICEEDKLDYGRSITGDKKILLPDDILAADRKEANARTEVVAANSIPADWLGLDLGPRTIDNYKNIIRNAKTIVWAGPMGVFEIDKFASGTREIGKAVAEATKTGAVSVVGGGDTVAAITRFSLTAQISHVSTGGGASLEFLEGRDLPGIKVLKDKQ